MKRLIKIALLAAINAHALTLSVNTGKTRSNEDYFVLHLQQNRPFVCSGEAFEGVQYYRCEFEGGLPDAPLAQKLPFANITATQKNGSYELLIVPNLPSRLIDASTDLHSTTELVAPHSPKGSGGLFSHTGTEAIVAPLDKKNPASDLRGR